MNAIEMAARKRELTAPAESLSGSLVKLVTRAYDSLAMERLKAESGKAGYALLWLLGVPLPVLILIYLISN